MKVDIDDVIAYLNQCAADAYDRDGDGSQYGWAYSTAATRLFAAKTQGEFE